VLTAAVLRSAARVASSLATSIGVLPSCAPRQGAGSRAGALSAHICAVGDGCDSRSAGRRQRIAQSPPPPRAAASAGGRATAAADDHSTCAHGVARGVDGAARADTHGQRRRAYKEGRRLTRENERGRARRRCRRHRRRRRRALCNVRAAMRSSAGCACVCVVLTCAHVCFRLLVRSSLQQQRHDGRVAAICGAVQRREAKLRAQQQHT
jgi:hypothetical protein